MKTSHSKSQLLTHKQKHFECIPRPGPANRKKSQSNSNCNKADKSKVGTNTGDDNSDISEIKNQQLFGIIETFYNTLCSLPMQMLINSSDPQFWLNQQQQTFKQLSKKLQRIRKTKDYEYYNWKLQSVEKLLENIAENMSMLQKINNLKGYYSGTDSSNYRSRNSSALESDQGISRAKQCSKGQMVSYDQYEIRNNRSQGRSADSSHSSELMAETVQSDEQISVDCEKPLVQSEFFRKNFKREVLKVGENQNTANNHPDSQNIGWFKMNHKHIQSKDKTLAKLPVSKQNQSSRTIANNASGRFLEDRLQTTINYLNNDSNNEIKNQFTQDYNKEQNTIQSLDPSPKADTTQEYIIMIKQLRLQLLNKDKQIQKLLISQQEYEQSIQIFKDRENQKNMQILFFKESVSNGQKDKEKLQSQIKALQDYQEELKQTIRFQRDRNKRQNKERQKMEEKYYEETNIKEQFVAQINRLKQENRECKRNERVMKQKLEVYKKKYFQLYGQLQQSKQNQQLLIAELQQHRDRTKSVKSPYEQVKEALEHHKEKLLDQSF